LSRALDALCLIAGVAVAQEHVWSIGPRDLPPPAHASRELRNRLAATPTPDHSAAKERAPATAAEWRSLVQQVDGQSAAIAKALAEKTGVSVKADRIAGVKVYRVEPPQVAPEHANHLFLNLHGGAWVFNGGLGATSEAVQIAHKLRMRVIAIDYRRPPEFPAPAAMQDVVAVWWELARTHDPARMALGGGSAGGNLTLTATLRLKELGLALPAAIYVGTPVVDLEKAGDSRFMNDGVDPGLTWDNLLSAAAKAYAGGGRYTDPHLSPIYADVTGFPPTYLITGTRDLLLSDTVTMHRKLRSAGVEADLHVYEGVGHAEYVIEGPECDQHYAELKTFLVRRLRP
jgi:acetyl esterase/lipase